MEKKIKFNGSYSLKISRVKEKDFPYEGQQIASTSELREFLKTLQSADNEKFVALYLNADNRLICLQTTNGIVNQAVVYPREVIRHALIVNATAVIFAHNHPSGNTRPSEADIRLTKIIQEVAKVLDITTHDHIIIAGDSDKFFSFREEGLLQESGNSRRE